MNSMKFEMGLERKQFLFWEEAKKMEDKNVFVALKPEENEEDGNSGENREVRTWWDNIKKEKREKGEKGEKEKKEN